MADFLPTSLLYISILLVYIDAPTSKRVPSSHLVCVHVREAFGGAPPQDKEREAGRILWQYIPHNAAWHTTRITLQRYCSYYPLPSLLAISNLTAATYYITVSIT